jgi:tetratricopeptide (TPR) repeat protein
MTLKRFHSTTQFFLFLDMKKMFFALLGLFLMASPSFAQEGEKMAKSAGKALTSYNIDPQGNSGKLDEAKQKIDQALQTPEAQALASAWLTKGEVYNTMSNRDMLKKQLDPNAQIPDNDNGLEAFNAFAKVLELSTKKYEKNDALKGIAEAQAALINGGVVKFQANQYDKAFTYAEAALKSHELLKAGNQKSFLDDPAQHSEQVYFTGLAAQYAKNCKDALRYYEMMIAKNTDKPEVYNGIYACKAEMGDDAGAKKILADGVAKFPDNTELLFSQINVYLKEGKLDQLVSSLKQAIAKEPGNPSLYINLARVYDDLHTREEKAGNAAKALEYENEAISYYKQSAEKDQKSPDPHYMLGAMYYNKAAAVATEMNGLDNTAAGLKKYGELNKKMLALFDQALPYFQKAESLDANDMNTLIALNEIYARKEDELSLEFKKRLEVVKGGGKNPGSHFKF